MGNERKYSQKNKKSKNVQYSVRNTEQLKRTSKSFLLRKRRGEPAIFLEFGLKPKLVSILT